MLVTNKTAKSYTISLDPKRRSTGMITMIHSQGLQMCQNSFGLADCSLRSLSKPQDIILMELRCKLSESKLIRNMVLVTMSKTLDLTFVETCYTLTETIACKSNWKTFVASSTSVPSSPSLTPTTS